MRAKKKHYSMPRDYVTVGVHLKEARLKTNLTQKDVADALGLSSPQFISNFECGIALPSLRNLRLLVKLYGMDVKELLDLIVEVERQKLLEAITAKRLPK